MQGIESGDFTIGIQHREAVRADEHTLGMADGVFSSILLAQRKGPETPGHALMDASDVHRQRLQGPGPTADALLESFNS